MKKVAVILAGCGHRDGAEIHESVFTLLALDQNGAAYECFAPDKAQRDVINHLTGEPASETRNVLVEAARIARGAIRDVAQAKVEDFDAVILPGGFGCAKNICDFAVNGSDMTMDAQVAAFVSGMHAAGKPVGLICIAPAMTPLIEPKARFTIGNDAGTAAAIEKIGGSHVNCAVDDCVVDREQKIVTTPAYMLATRISEAHAGISKAVREVLALV